MARGPQDVPLVLQQLFRVVLWLHRVECQCLSGCPRILAIVYYGEG